jgi:hypothetical protein
MTNAATQEATIAAAARIGFVIPSGHIDEYAALLAKTHAACEAILAEEGRSIRLLALVMHFRKFTEAT